MNNRILQSYNNRIASLMGEIMDAGFSADLLKKQGLAYNTYEEDTDVRITEVELGKGKTARKFTLASYCDNRFCWHHDVFGSIAQLPLPRLKQIAKELTETVAALVAAEENGEKKPARPRTPRKPNTRSSKPAADNKPPRKRTAKKEEKPGEKPPRNRTASKKEAPVKEEASAT